MNREKRRPRRPPRLDPKPKARTKPCGCHKRLFPTEHEAQAAAIRVSVHVGSLRVYPCPNKPGFHLTRLREWKGPS